MSAPPPLPNAEAVRRTRKRALVIVLAFVVLSLGGVVALYLKVQSYFLGTEEYAQAMALVQRSPQTIAKLGDGIDRDGLISANTNTSFNTDVTSTFMSVPVAGTRGSGVAVFTATRRGDTVRIARLVLVTEEGGRQVETMIVEPGAE